MLGKYSTTELHPQPICKYSEMPPSFSSQFRISKITPKENCVRVLSSKDFKQFPLRPPFSAHKGALVP